MIPRLPARLRSAVEQYIAGKYRAKYPKVKGASRGKGKGHSKPHGHD